jgi:cell division transport system permease protein
MRAASCSTKAACTLMNEAMTDLRERPDVRKPARRAEVEKSPSTSGTPIIPVKSIAGQALIAVIAIMTFLASLTTGAVMLVLASAAEWQSEVAREMTIQVLPSAGRDIEAQVNKAAEIARAAPGVIDVRPYSKEESSRLLEPWLGTGLSLEDLPIPRLIVVRVASGAALDLDALRANLVAQVTGATLDDHRGWVGRMRGMADTAAAGGITILVLMLVATVLSVTFVTRGAMATNRQIIGVLHFIGARNDFIAGQFRRHFLVLGLIGGGIGGGAAVVMFLLAGVVGNWFLATPGGDQAAALFGTFSIGVIGYAAMLAQVIVIAFVTAETSRQVVNRTLEAVE